MIQKVVWKTAAILPQLNVLIMWGKSPIESVWQFNYEQVNELDPLACQWWDQLWPAVHVEKQGKLPDRTRQLMVQWGKISITTMC